jgi:hypothetical protein
MSSSGEGAETGARLDPVASTFCNSALEASRRDMICGN